MTTPTPPPSDAPPVGVPLTDAERFYAVKAAIERAMQDERDGKPCGCIIEAGCEAREYDDPSYAANGFIWSAAEAACLAGAGRPVPAPSAAPAEPAGGGEFVEGLVSLKAQSERIAALHPNDQPRYASGIRPFGTGDLRHFIEVLTSALAALQAAPAPHCQPCGGTVQGWVCQTCEAEFQEENGLLVLNVAGVGEAFNANAAFWAYRVKRNSAAPHWKDWRVTTDRHAAGGYAADGGWEVVALAPPPDADIVAKLVGAAEKLTRTLNCAPRGMIAEFGTDAVEGLDELTEALAARQSGGV